MQTLRSFEHFFTHPSFPLTFWESRRKCLLILADTQCRYHLFFPVSCFLTPPGLGILLRILMIRNYQSSSPSILHSHIYTSPFPSLYVTILFPQSSGSIWILKVLNKCWWTIKALFKLLLKISYVFLTRELNTLHPCMKLPSVLQGKVYSK